MIIQNNILTIEEKPDARIGLVILGMILAVGIPLAFAADDGSAWFIFWVIVGWSLYSIYQTRTLRWVMDKQTGRITYHRGGLLGTTIHQTHLEFPMTEVAKIEVKRFVTRGADMFECRLVRKGHPPILLSRTKTRLSQCERLAKDVHEFLALERPVHFID